MTLPPLTVADLYTRYNYEWVFHETIVSIHVQRF